MRRILITACALIMLALTVSADVLHLKDGRTFDGKVVAETEREIEFEYRTPAGSAVLTFPRKAILSLEYTEHTAYEALMQEFHARRAAARSSNRLQAWEDLATWASKNDLERQALPAWRKVLQARLNKLTRASQAIELAERAEELGLDDLARTAWEIGLELDGDHPEIREALGFHRHEGEWLTESEYQAVLAEQRRQERLRREALRKAREAEERADRLAKKVEETERKVGELSRKLDEERRRSSSNILILSNPREYRGYNGRYDRSDDYYYRHGVYRTYPLGGYVIPQGGVKVFGGNCLKPRVLGGSLRVNLGN